MLKLVILALALIAFAVFALSVRIIFKRNGRFPNTHISQNEALRKQGIQCASHDNDSCHQCSCGIKE